MKKSAQKNLYQMCGPAHKKTREDILRDIDCLQLASTKEVFQNAAEAFLTKWRPLQPEFCEYFQQEWILQNENWYEGAEVKSPSTNNALEAFNRNIKDSGTFRQRFALSKFLTVAMKLVGDWSDEYKNGLEVFMKTATITLEHSTAAYQWVKQTKNKRIVCSRIETDYKIYSVPAKDLTEVPIFSKAWTTFDDYRSQHFSSYDVKIPTSTEKSIQQKKYV